MIDFQEIRNFIYDLSDSAVDFAIDIVDAVEEFFEEE